MPYLKASRLNKVICLDPPSGVEHPVGINQVISVLLDEWSDYLVEHKHDITLQSA
jgi:hypothetical protein